jgi:hypothetical protein
MGTYDSVKVRVAAARGASMLGLRGESARFDGLGWFVTHTDRDRSLCNPWLPAVAQGRVILGSAGAGR